MLAIKLQTLNSQNFDFWLDLTKLLTLNKFFTKSENTAAKKLCGEAVALEIPRKLTFCNAVGCKTEILMELLHTKEIYLKCLRTAILQKSAS